MRLVASRSDGLSKLAPLSASAAEGRPCLDLCTQLSTKLGAEGGYAVRVRVLHGFADATVIEDRDFSLRRPVSGAVRARRQDKAARRRSSVEGPGVMDEDDAYRRKVSAARRACSKLRDRVRGARLDRMFTFTTRGLLESRGAAKAAWLRFRKDVGRFYPGRKFAYVVVVERHASGCFHLHAGVRGFWDVRRLTLIWHRVLTGRRLMRPLPCAESPGSIDVPSTKKGFVRPWKVRQIARYLSKYVGKDFLEVGARSRRFTCSEGIDLPIVLWARISTCLDGSHVARVRRALDQLGFFGTGPPFEFSIPGRLCWMVSGEQILGKLRDA